MDLYEIVTECLQDSADFFPDNMNIPDQLIAMVGEVGEFANLIKKVSRGSLDFADPETLMAIKFELVDVFIYLCNLAGLLNLNLEEGYRAKRSINVERFLKSNRNDSGSHNGVLPENS